MANFVKKAFNKVGQSLGFVAPDTEKVDTSASIAANQAAADNLKSSEELTKEGMANASATAANAGTLAADQARNAMANSGGGKLARALMAAQAGNDAGQTAYNNNVTQGIATAQNQNHARSSILQNQANIQAQAAQTNAAQQNAANQYQTSALSGILKPMIGSAGSAVATKLFRW